MTINQMKIFMAVCDYGSLTAAAHLLRLSQPSVSVAVKKIEDEIGVRIFFRQNKRMVLTDAGYAMRADISKILSDIEEMELRTRRFSPEQKRIRLGITSMNAVFIYPKLLLNFKRLHPEIQMEIFESSTDDSISRLKRDRLDVAIIIAKQKKIEPFDCTLLQYSEVVGCAREGHPLAGRRDVDYEELGSENLILSGRYSSFTGAIQEKILNDNGARPPILVHAKQLLFMMQMIKGDNAVAFFLEDVVDAYPDKTVAKFYFSEPVIYNIVLLTRMDIPHPPAVETFVSYCRRYGLKNE